MNLCKKDCKKCTYFNSCGGCSYCEASLCDSNCKVCGSICIKRGKGLVYINNIIKQELEIKKNKNFDIPGYIPILPDRLNNLLDIDDIKLIALHGGNALKSNGQGVRRLYRENGYNKAINIGKNIDGILEFYVRDRTLEGIWDSRESLYKELKDMKLKAVIAPNFSVYEDTPRVEHLYNIRRSIIIYNELIDYGINAIPDISWYNINDLDFWIEKLNNSECSIIAFSFQVVDVRLKASNLWKNYLAGFRYLIKNLNKNIKIIIVGLNSYNRIKEVYDSAKNSKVESIHVLNQTAYINCQRGVLTEGNVRDIITSREELLKMNIKYLNGIYDLDLRRETMEVAKG